MEGSKGSQHDVLLLYFFFVFGFFVLRADLSFMVSSLSPPLLSLGSSSSSSFFLFLGNKSLFCFSQYPSNRAYPF